MSPALLVAACQPAPARLGAASVHVARRAAQRAQRRGESPAGRAGTLAFQALLCALCVLLMCCSPRLRLHFPCRRASHDAARGPCLLLRLDFSPAGAPALPAGWEPGVTWAASSSAYALIHLEALAAGRARATVVKFQDGLSRGAAVEPEANWASTVIMELTRTIAQLPPARMRLTADGAVLVEGEGSGAMRAIMPLLFAALGGFNHDIFMPLLLEELDAADDKPLMQSVVVALHTWEALGGSGVPHADATLGAGMDDAEARAGEAAALQGETDALLTTLATSGRRKDHGPRRLWRGARR